MTFERLDLTELETVLEDLFAQPEFGDMPEEAKQQYRTLVIELPEELDGPSLELMETLLTEPRFAELKAYIEQKRREPQPMGIVHEPPERKSLRAGRGSLGVPMWEARREHPRNVRRRR